MLIVLPLNASETKISAPFAWQNHQTPEENSVQSVTTEYTMYNGFCLDLLRQFRLILGKILVALFL